MQAALDPAGDGRYFARYRVISRADGQERWVEATGQVSFEESRAFRLVGTVQEITARVLADAALRQGREDFARALEVGQTGWWRLDTGRNVLTWAEETYRIFGLPPGTPLTYETFLGCVHPDDRAEVDAQWQAAVRGAPYDIEHRIVTEGRVKWVREKAYLEYDGEGRLLCGFGIAQDITARREAEEARRASEERYRHVLRHSPAGIVQADAEGRMVMVNHRWCEMLGYPEAELLGRSVVEVTAPDFRPATIAAVGRLAQDGAGFTIEKNYVRKDGSLLMAESTVSALRTEAGDFAGLVAVVLDITARKEAEHRLRESRELFRTLAASAPVGIFRTDAAGGCTFVNECWTTLSGLTVEESLGDGWARALHAEDRDRVAAEWTRATREGARFSAEYRFQAKDGEVVSVMGRAVPERDAEGKVTGYVGTITDITERQAAEERERATAVLLDTLLAQAPIGFCYLDRELRYVRINERLAEINGIAARDHLGRTVAEIVPTLLPAVEEVTTRILATGRAVENHEFTGETAREPGVAHHWNESWYPVHDARGEIAGFGVVVEEITARKAAEARLRESEERMQQALRVSRSMTFEWDVATDRVRRSESCGAILGLRARRR